MPLARINRVALHAPGERLTAEELRQRACTELLRQAACGEGLLTADDAPGADGVPSEAAANAIDRLLERVLNLPEPDDALCRRHHAANAAIFSSGERVRVRHILFAVTPGVDVTALRQRAESALLDLRCADRGEAPGKREGAADPFGQAAAELSNCPSGSAGGALGWLVAADCAPEFARELFGRSEVGVLPRLVHSRFGLHVVEVLEREPGVPLPFEAVRGAVQASLRQKAFVTALRQYLRVLAGRAEVEGVELETAGIPLVQ